MKRLLISMINILRIYILNVITQLLKRVPLLIVLILVTGCATILPMKHDYKSQENFPVPFNKVWNLSNNFLARNVSAIETADRKPGFLLTKEFNVPYEGFQYKSIYADCGQLAGLYVYHEIIGYYELYISESADNKTTLRIMPHYRASLWLGKSFKGWIQCQSRGYVEKLLIDDIWANIQKSSPEEDMSNQPENESEKISTDDILGIQDNDNKETSEPEISLMPETELKKLKIKYEKALEEKEELNNELLALKKDNKDENSDEDSIDSDVSHKESPPEVDTKQDSDKLTQSDMKSIDKELLAEFESYRQNRDNRSLMYTIQTGSFLEMDRAQVQFDFISDLLQDEDYDNLRIEKIGNIYAVRFGKYDSYSSAKDMLRNYITDLLQAKDYYNIKIEQTDGTYTVRLGKYDKYSSAKDMLKKVIRAIRSPIVLKAYVKENRIMQPQDIKAQ
jgi:hypothetical protein